jgi:sugar lactone lactonase YvrE
MRYRHDDAAQQRIPADRCAREIRALLRHPVQRLRRLNAEGAIWVQTADIRAVTHRADSPEGAVVRIREGGEVLQRIEHDKDIFAVTLGGPDRKTLFVLATEFRGVDKLQEVAAARIGEVVISQAPAPGAGWP